MEPFFAITSPVLTVCFICGLTDGLFVFDPPDQGKVKGCLQERYDVLQQLRQQLCGGLHSAICEWAVFRLPNGVALICVTVG